MTDVRGRVKGVPAGVLALILMPAIVVVAVQNPPDQFAELQRALDAAPPGLRFAELSTCCGDPLGTMYSVTGRTTGRYQMFVSGSAIDIRLSPSTAAYPPAPSAAPRFVLAAFQRPVEQSREAAAAIAPGSLPAVTFVATGASSGDAFRLLVVPGAGIEGRLLAPDGLVLEPLSAGPATATDARAIVRNLPGFSAEFSKDPPPAGTMYRVADARQQERLKPMRHLLRTSDGLSAARRLHPDNEPVEYLTFVKQWSIWTRLEKWDLRAFGEQFTARTRKNLESQKQPWTKALEDRVRALIPGRWGDVQTVIRAADALASQSPR